MYLGLFIMCGFVLFDTQLIIEKAENGDKDYVWWGITDCMSSQAQMKTMQIMQKHCCSTNSVTTLS